MTRRKRSSMAGLAGKAAKQTDNELAQEEIDLLRRTSIDWESLRPQITDEELYNKLIEIVNESTRKNESLAELQNRLKSLGEEGLKLATKVISLIK